MRGITSVALEPLVPDAETTGCAHLPRVRFSNVTSNVPVRVATTARLKRRTPFTSAVTTTRSPALKKTPSIVSGCDETAVNAGLPPANAGKAPTAIARTMLANAIRTLVKIPRSRRSNRRYPEGRRG